jgi:hypothetical protein
MPAIRGSHEPRVPENLNPSSSSEASTHAPKVSPGEGRQKLNQTYENAPLPTVPKNRARQSDEELPPAKRPKLDETRYRNSGLPEREAALGPKNYDDGTRKSNYKPQPQENHLYPDQARMPWDYTRPSMGDKLTDRMKENPADQGQYSKIVQSDVKGKGLEKLTFSRNHTIADSSNARLLTEAFNSNMRPGDAAHEAVNHYISTMAAHGTPEAQ